MAVFVGPSLRLAYVPAPMLLAVQDGRLALLASPEDWTELAGAHERFVEDYNAQAHLAHAGREDGRRSPAGSGTARKS